MPFNWCAQNVSCAFLSFVTILLIASVINNIVSFCSYGAQTRPNVAFEELHNTWS